jgi:hypothetical protein
MPVSVWDIDGIKPGEERNIVEILIPRCMYGIFEVSKGSDQIHSVESALQNSTTCLFLWDQYQGIDPNIFGEIQTRVDKAFIRSYMDTKHLDMEVAVFLRGHSKVDPNNSQVSIAKVGRLSRDYLGEIENLYEIIRVIDGGGQEMETKPATFREAKENVLRDWIAVCLNSRFPGGTTSETFSKRGKTDIRLHIGRVPVLVIECKLWKGAVQFREAIGQLLSYLTHRYSWGIIIVFSRNQEFTRVLQVIWDEIPKHKSYKHGRAKTDSSHFMSFNTLPSDPDKIVELHYLNYDLSM